MSDNDEYTIRFRAYPNIVVLGPNVGIAMTDAERLDAVVRILLTLVAKVPCSWCGDMCHNYKNSDVDEALQRLGMIVPRDEWPEVP